jgi:hypothetical protein
MTDAIAITAEAIVWLALRDAGRLAWKVVYLVGAYPEKG